MDASKIQQAREEDMCRTREEILSSDIILQNFVREINEMEERVLTKKTENGETMIEVLRDRADVENKVLTIQNSEELFFIRKAAERQNREIAKYPSILYQLVKIPKVAYPLLVATALVIWLISGIGNIEVAAAVESVGIKVSDPNQINTVVLVAVAGLVFSAVLSYGSYLEKKFAGRKSDDE